MVGLWLVLGKADKQPPSSAEVIWSVLAVVALLLLGAVAILWTKRWRAELSQAGDSAEDQLERYRTLLARGDLTAAEYDQITGVLRSRAPPAAPAPPAQEKPPDPPAALPPDA